MSTYSGRSSAVNLPAVCASSRKSFISDSLSALIDSFSESSSLVIFAWSLIILRTSPSVSLSSCAESRLSAFFTSFKSSMICRLFCDGLFADSFSFSSCFISVGPSNLPSSFICNALALLGIGHKVHSFTDDLMSTGVSPKPSRLSTTTSSIQLSPGTAESKLILAPFR